MNDRSIMIEDLACRLLGAPLAQIPVQEVQLFPGELPESLPQNIPLPDDAQLIGSMRRAQEWRIVLEIEGGIETTLSTIRERFAALGWVEKDWLGQPVGGGFVQSGMANSVIFCREKADPAVTVVLNERNHDVTEVYIWVNQDSRRRLCSSIERDRGIPRSLLPELKTPANAATGFVSGGGSDDRWHSSIIIHTSQNVEDLEANYRTQLQAAEWNLIEHHATSAFAWSGWLFSDELGDSWSGMLIVLNRPGASGECYAYLSATLLH